MFSIENGVFYGEVISFLIGTSSLPIQLDMFSFNVETIFAQVINFVDISFYVLIGNILNHVAPFKVRIWA